MNDTYYIYIENNKKTIVSPAVHVIKNDHVISTTSLFGTPTIKRAHEVAQEYLQQYPNAQIVNHWKE